VTSAPGEHPAGIAADRVAGEVEPCLDARSALAVGDVRTPTVQQQQLTTSPISPRILCTTLLDLSLT